ncbi:MAG: 50S ribosomal protein L23 [Candidatus Omnitrophica bacterium]|nr:50S ribosomal protein L23 [Candidatus Omnitrophota bacterium]
MKISYDIVKSVLRTEKSTKLLAQNKYLFLVDTRANKIEIKKAVEDIFKVKVSSVNVINMQGKLRRVRYKLGRRSDWKKAWVTLKEGNTIDVAST